MFPAVIEYLEKLDESEFVDLCEKPKGNTHFHIIESMIEQRMSHEFNVSQEMVQAEIHDHLFKTAVKKLKTC